MSRSTSQPRSNLARFREYLGYPLSVRRLLRACLVLAVVSYSTPSSSLHVHAYAGGHTHHDHDHGPAAHEHDRPAPSSSAFAHLSSCSPASHAVFLSKATPAGRTTTVFAVPFETARAVSCDQIRRSPPRCRSLTRGNTVPRGLQPRHLAPGPPQLPPEIRLVCPANFRS